MTNPRNSGLADGLLLLMQAAGGGLSACGRFSGWRALGDHRSRNDCAKLNLAGCVTMGATVRERGQIRFAVLQPENTSHRRGGSLFRLFGQNRVLVFIPGRATAQEFQDLIA